MEILHIAVPAAILLVAFSIGIFWWAVKHGQFDDLERQGMNILLDEGPKKKAKSTGKKTQTRSEMTAKAENVESTKNINAKH